MTFSYRLGVNDGATEHVPDASRWSDDDYRRGWLAGRFIAAGLWWMVS